jgi:hypothetical protein
MHVPGQKSQPRWCVQSKNHYEWTCCLACHQDVPWHGDDRLAVDFRKAIASKAPASKTRAACPPITTDHLKALCKHLNLHSNPFDISVFTVACCAFWGVNHLGELIVPSLSDKEPNHCMSCTCNLQFKENPHGSSTASLHIPWTKTTHSIGADLLLSSWDDP